jgi:golgi phosphoprotein 3
MLSLPEEVLVLALDDQKGTIIPVAEKPLSMALISAALSELCLRHKIRIDEYSMVSVLDTTETGEPLLELILARMRQQTHEQPAAYWLQSLGSLGQSAVDLVRDSLVRKGVLKIETTRKLLIFTEERALNRNDLYERSIRERVRNAVLNGGPADERTMALIGLVKMAQLTETVFGFEDATRARARIDEMTTPQAAGYTAPYPPNGYYDRAAQPEGMAMGAGMGMMSGMAQAMMFGMLAQSMFWGVGGWGMPFMPGFGAPMPGAEEAPAEGFEDVPADDGGGFDLGGGGDFEM